MNTLEKALKRSQIPDCSSGPMSLAKEDRRVLAAEVERLRLELQDTRNAVRLVAQAKRDEVLR